MTGEEFFVLVMFVIVLAIALFHYIPRIRRMLDERAAKRREQEENELSASAPEPEEKVEQKSNKPGCED